MKHIWSRLGRRAGAVIVFAVLLAALAGGASALAGHGTSTATHTIAAAGGVARFHGDGTTTCGVPAGSTLTGNWTHGDYVASWAATGDKAKTLAAAQSDCGKPLSSMTVAGTTDPSPEPTPSVDEKGDQNDEHADVDDNHGDNNNVDTGEHGDHNGEHENADNGDNNNDHSQHDAHHGDGDQGHGDHGGGDHGNSDEGGSGD